jgi:diguanylate cyclase (GGDEF)-like protein
MFNYPQQQNSLRNQARNELLSPLSKEQLETILDTSPLGLAMMNYSDGIITYVNPALTESANTSADAIIGTSAADYCHDKNALNWVLSELKNDCAIENYKIQISSPNSMIVWCELNITSIWLGEDRVVLCWFSPFAELEQVSANLTDSDKCDTLTGLANKAYFEQYLNQATYRSCKNIGTYTLLYLGIEGFERAADNYGHQYLKQILVAVVSRIQDCLDGDFIARVSDDEFALIIESTRSHHQAGIEKAEKVLTAVIEPYIIDGRRALLSASIGVTDFVDASHCADNIVIEARKSMCRAKYSGRSRIWT